MFQALSPLPADPILNLIVKCKNDPNPNKVDLGVGVYKDEQGHTPIMKAVREAEQLMINQQTTKTYIGPAGSELFNQEIRSLLLGKDHSAIRDGRIVSVQTPGGTGALRVAAELVYKASPSATIWVSDPTWANHIPTFIAAGLTVKNYPYYDFASKSIRFEAMLDTLNSAKAGDVVLLHGCCHNPSGADLTQDQWQAISELLLKKGLTPFIDIAYQGLGDGLEEDAYGLRLMADTQPEVVIASSCSKNFGLYRERTGAALVVTRNKEEAAVTQSNLNSVVRINYSMPPAHGAAIVETILSDTRLTQAWKTELDEVRHRINAMRGQLARSIQEINANLDFSFIEQQKGMFSFLGLSPSQVELLQTEHSIYVVGSSRMSIAGLNQKNVSHVAQAVVDVLAKG
jgi:aspartate aminotransferase